MQGKKVWNEREGKEMTRKELVDAYIVPSLQKASQILLDYENGHKSCVWKSWAKQKIYWAED